MAFEYQRNPALLSLRRIAFGKSIALRQVFHFLEVMFQSFVRCRKRQCLGLCLESLLGQSRRVEAGCMGGSLYSGVNVMNRSGDSCVSVAL